VLHPRREVAALADGDAVADAAPRCRVIGSAASVSVAGLSVMIECIPTPLILRPSSPRLASALTFSMALAPQP
jgi:hypothetical protein